MRAGNRKGVRGGSTLEIARVGSMSAGKRRRERKIDEGRE